MHYSQTIVRRQQREATRHPVMMRETLLLLLGLVTRLLLPGCAAADQPLPSPDIPVSLRPVPCDTTTEEMQELFRENLEEDLKPWRAMRLNMSAFDTAMRQWPETEIMHLFLMYNNTLYFVRQANPRKDCDTCQFMYMNFVRAVDHWRQYMTFPDTLFFFSTNDDATCGLMEGGDCPLPMLTISKKLSHRIWGTNTDILIPKPPSRPVSNLKTFPWDRKSDKAVWRGTRWCDMKVPQQHVHCSRWHVAELMNRSAEARDWLDFGYSAGDETCPRASMITPPDFARYKFLLNLDGFSAAYRLGSWLLMNSVVLKEESTKIEYYYRSLRPWEHYIPVFKDNSTDLIDILRQYRQPHRETELMTIARKSTEFAAKFCCPRARMLYWQRVLTEYKSLFPDMDREIQNKWWPMIRARLREQPEPH